MIELIGLVVVSVLGYSFVQSRQRGDVSDEEKKQNPTLIETIGEAIETAHVYSEKYHLKTKYEIENFEWFRNFELYVSRALDHAQFYTNLEKELSADTDLRKFFDQAMEKYAKMDDGSLQDVKHRAPDQTWYDSGLPSPDWSSVEQKICEDVRKSYGDHLEEHRRLVRDVNKKLTNDVQLAALFRKALFERGLEALHRDFFDQKKQNSTDILPKKPSSTSNIIIPPTLPRTVDAKKPDVLPLSSEIDIFSQSRQTELDKKKERKTGISSGAARIVEPSLDEFERMPTPLEAGERQVLSFFLECLDPNWEIYIQPHLNGIRPDFVLLNPSVGIAVFEVKNWDFEAAKYFAKAVSSDRKELWAKLNGKEFSKEHDNPFRKIARYKQEIYDIYCPRLRSRAGFAAITGGVIFPSAPTKDVHALQKEFVIDTDNNVPAVYLPVCGREELLAKDMAKIFPEAKRERSNLMSAALADDLRGWLVEPDSSKTQREPLPLDAKQRRLAETRTTSGFRRIKGPAGSGKSIVLAARAARLASEGKKVLIVTFNITLWHYLRDMIRRDISSSKNMENVTFTHFHMWCRNVCDEAGLGSSYANLFSEVRKLEALSKNSESIKRKIAELIGVIMDHDVPNLAVTAALSPRAPRYDAILVDEGQDFLPLWWNALKNCKQPNGEMMLVADTTQDIYGKSSSWTDEAMNGAGFSGEWSRLDVSYRLPQKALEAAREFAEWYLPFDKLDLAKTSAGGLEIESCHLRWVQCSPDKAKKHCVDAILAMMRNTRRDTGLANSDITFICNEISFGKSVTDELNTYTGVRTINTFEPDRAEQVRSKMAFWMGDARIKATTIHSFKGWESRLLVVHVGNAVGDESLASIYAALTRLKHSPLGSWLTVVCSAPDLADYGRSWAKFESLETDTP